MGTGHSQQSFFKSEWKHSLCHGGTLRQKRAGRGARALSSREPIHVVFKVDRSKLRFGLRSSQTQGLALKIIHQYSRKFFVKIEQISIQNDHCHLLVRASRRSHFHHFFRVTAGQIAQRFKLEGHLSAKNSHAIHVANCRTKNSVTGTPKAKPQRGTGLWKHRPFSRVVRGWKAYKIVKDYIWLNELEAIGKVPYRKSRRRGLSSGEWELFRW